MKKKNKSLFILSILVLTCVWACSKLNQVTDAITQPSAREIYEREFQERPAVFSRWQAEFEAAKKDSLRVNLPYAEAGKFSFQQNEVLSYEVQLQKGTIFKVEVKKDSVHHRVFIDLFQQKDSTFHHVESNQLEENHLRFQPKESGTYRIMVQPEVAAHTPFFISFYEEPTYHFPVAGKGNEAIQSFWGNERDGGKRSHEGIDIFAPRGTPVVAATDGRISRTGNRGLGGKQVWLREGMFGNSLYYAHLDSIIAKSGQKVKIGDTLGLVGNTGNARTTPPHLHFGIYRSGAINPLPFVFQTEKLNRTSFPQQFQTNYLVIATAKANLRQGPDTSYQKIGEVSRNDTIQLLGEYKNWLHVKTPGQQAFLHASLAKGLK